MLQFFTTRIKWAWEVKLKYRRCLCLPHMVSWGSGIRRKITPMIHYYYGRALDYYSKFSWNCSLFFVTLCIWRRLDSCFVGCPSFGVCLIFPYNQIWVCIFGKRGTEALFPSQRIISGKVCCCCVSLLVTVALVTIESDELAVDHSAILQLDQLRFPISPSDVYFGNSCWDNSV